MEIVEVQQDYPFPAEHVWHLTGEFSGLGKWLPGVTCCEVTGAGARDAGGNAERRVTLADGSVTRESLETLDDNQYAYSYRILEAKGFDPDSVYIGRFRIESLTEEQCRIHWSAEFTVPEQLPVAKINKIRDRVTQMYQFFLAHLNTVLKEG
ncbi:MAG: SRPBCC family protein [Pseudomonadales bacterium]|nr:SRPBCC family protein [Pseudomonadales bacterium]